MCVFHHNSCPYCNIVSQEKQEENDFGIYIFVI